MCIYNGPGVQTNWLCSQWNGCYQLIPWPVNLLGLFTSYVALVVVDKVPCPSMWSPVRRLHHKPRILRRILHGFRSSILLKMCQFLPFHFNLKDILPMWLVWDNFLCISIRKVWFTAWNTSESHIRFIVLSKAWLVPFFAASQHVSFDPFETASVTQYINPFAFSVFPFS